VYAVPVIGTGQHRSFIAPIARHSDAHGIIDRTKVRHNTCWILPIEQVDDANQAHAVIVCVRVLGWGLGRHYQHLGRLENKAYIP
jgi:hypothetical protein